MEHLEDLMLPTNIVQLLTTYEDVLREALPELIQGVYLYGSISLNAFNRRTSDVDFVTTVDRRLTEEEISILQNLHAEFELHNPLAKQLDGFYIPVDNLQKGTAEETHPYFRESRFQGLAPLRSIARKQLEQAVTVFGPPLQVKPQEWQDIKREMTYNLNEYWANKTTQIELFAEDSWVAFAVLTLLRIRHTLLSKQIISKQQAGKQALHSMPSCWHLLIRESLRIQSGAECNSLYSSTLERTNEVIQFHREIIRECNQLLLD